MVEHVIGNDGVVSPILISGTIKEKRHPRGCLLSLIGLNHKKSDYSIPENSNSAKIIGLLKKCHPFFALSKNQGIFKLFFKAVDALNFACRQNRHDTIYFSFFKKYLTFV